MFAFSENAIDSTELAQRLHNPASGAIVTFEGRVRETNEGRSVTLLEYEAYTALAVNEGQRIIEQAKARFAIIDCICIHRTGALAVGDLAVFVGVNAAHRDAAFAACRFIIDEVKQRVPIWKKEHYADGATAWVNCAEHNHAAAGARKHEQIAEAHNLSSCELDILELSRSELDSFQVIDIREIDEDPGNILRSLLMREITRLPLSKINPRDPGLDPQRKYLFVCQRGRRSANLVAILREHGYNNVYSVKGGVDAVRRKYIA
jgi:molybdopterin synthase catalytic subunit/rhodanese-related sulfurtransferase